jgi:hypothetical protein
LTPIGNSAYTINPQPVRLSNSISNGNFDDDILKTLVPNLVPNLNKLRSLLLITPTGRLRGFYCTADTSFRVIS